MQKNQKTIAAYQNHVAEYLANSPQKATGGIKSWLDKVAQQLDTKTRIIEIGSAMGRDARYLQNSAFKSSAPTPRLPS